MHFRGEKKKEKTKIIGQYSKISSQPAPQEIQSLRFRPSSRSLLLIPSCSDCFCYTRSGKIKLSFVRTSQLDKASCTKRGGRGRVRFHHSKSCSLVCNILPLCWFQFIFINYKTKLFLFHSELPGCNDKNLP